MLRLDVDRSDRTYEPGAKLGVKIIRDVDVEAERIVVSLFWYTAGVGIEDEGKVLSRELTVIPGRMENELSFELPEGPYSFSGPLGELRWRVEAKAVPSGVTAVVGFELLPAGRRIELSRVEMPRNGRFGFRIESW